MEGNAKKDQAVGLVLKKKKLSVDIYGTRVELFVPTLAQMEDYEDQVEGKKSREVLKVAVEFMKTLCLPEEVCKQMEYDDFISIVTFVRSGVKKN